MNQELKIKILVIGIGGCGINIVKDIKKSDVMYINTDLQSLNTIKNKKKKYIFKIGEKGLGAGMKPEVALELFKKSANIDNIKEIINKYDLIITVNGLGGGTGSSITPELLQIIKNMNKKIISLSIFPFFFEGKKRENLAKEYYTKIQKYSDMYIKLSNDNILKYIKKTKNLKLGFKDSLKEINYEVLNMLDTLLYTVNNDNLKEDINIDFNDLKTILEDKGKGIIGTSEGKNPSEAFKNIFKKELFDYKNINNCSGLIITFVTNENYPLYEISNFMEKEIYNYINEDTNLIFGTITDNSLKNIRIILIASNIEKKETKKKLYLNDEFVKKENFVLEDGLLSETNLDIPSYLRKKIG